MSEEPYRVRPVVYVRRRRPGTSNITSGIVYAAAVVVAVALGAVFYGSYEKSKDAAQRGYTQQDLPVGTKVVGVESRDAGSARPPAVVAAVTDEPDLTPPPIAKPAPAAIKPIVVAVEAAPGAMPAIHPELRVPWSVRPEDIPNPLKGKMDPVADTAVLTTAGGEDRNGGALKELPLRGNDTIVLAKFDTRQVMGWTVTRAAWHCKLTKGNLRELSFSTIPVDWEEGSGTLAAPAADGATYAGANAEKVPWTRDREPLPALLRGRGNSLVCYSEPDHPDNKAGEWVVFELRPDVVQALVSGSAVGLAICDEKGQLNADSAIASREDESFSHYIELEGRSIDLTPPAQIEGFKAYAHPDLRRAKTAGALLTWLAPGDDEMRGQAFRYDVRIAEADVAFDSAIPVRREKLPQPLPSGRVEQLVLEDLKPDTEYTFYIRAADEAGQFGPAAKTTLITAPALEFGETAALPAYDGSPVDIVPGQLTLQILNELSELDPMLDASADAAAKTSFIWDRTSRSVHLPAARDQHVGMLLRFTRKAAAFPVIGLETQPFIGPDGKSSDFQARFFQVAFAAAPGSRPGPELIGDALIPLSGTLDPSQSSFFVPGQKTMAVLAEINVPSNAAPGLYRSKLKVSVPQRPDANLNVFLTVASATLGEPAFHVELADEPTAVAQVCKKDFLNAAEMRAAELPYLQLAEEHRCRFVMIPRNEEGECPVPYAPRAQGAGAQWGVASWREWDDRFADQLAGASARHVILPLFENWPVAFQDGYSCEDQEVAVAGRAFQVYGGLSKGIPGCLSRDYWETFGAAAAAFGAHFDEGGRKGIEGHVWFTTEPSSNYVGRAPPWNLAQPLYRDDYLALQSFGEKGLSRGESAAGASQIIFRATVPDIRSLCDFGMGTFNLLAVEDTNYVLWPLLKERTALSHEKIWLQSRGLPTESGGARIAALALNAFLDGADGWGIRGVVGQADDWKRMDPSSLFYAGTALGESMPHPSLRLKAVRAIQEDIDLLLALQARRQWTRDQLRDYAAVYLPEQKGTFDVTPDNLLQLRCATLDWLGK